MKFLITSDIHVTDKPRDEYRWTLFPWIRDFVERRTIEGQVFNHLFILGDLTHEKDGHSAKLVNRVVEEMMALTDFFAHIWILKGNHDFVDPREPFFGFLDELRRIHFVVGPRRYREFMLLPYSKRPRKEWKKLDFFGTDYVFTHQTFNGALASNGQQLEGLSSKFFDPMTDARVISGDIHVPQDVGSVTYVGSPHPVNFGDGFEPRVLYFDGSKLQSVRRSTIAKSKVTIDHPTELYDEGISSGDQVKVILQLRRRDFSAWREHKAEIAEILAELGAENFGIELKEKGSGTNRRLKKVTGSPTTTSPGKTLERFCDALKVPGPIKAEGARLLEKI